MLYQLQNVLGQFRLDGCGHIPLVSLRYSPEGSAAQTAFTGGKVVAA